jgi:hypothetical protein
MLGSQYGNDIASMLAAAGQQGQQYSTDRGQQIGAASNLGSLYNAGQSNRIGAASAQGNLIGDERGRMLQASALAPALAQSDYTDIDRLMQSSNMKQNLAQQNINADINKWNFNQNKDLNKLQSLSQILQGFGGGTTTSNGTANTPLPPSSPLSGAIGGASMASSLGGAMLSPAVMGMMGEGGAMAASSMLGGPWGMLGGAILGGLFS